MENAKKPKTLLGFIVAGIKNEQQKGIKESKEIRYDRDFIESATEREIQNQIYITLRNIEKAQDNSCSKLSIIAGIAIFYLVCTILVFAFYILFFNLK